MRDPARIDRIIEKLREAWKLSPDQRLSQLVMNAVAYAANHRIIDIFHIEDKEIEKGLNRMIKELKNPKPMTPMAQALKAFVNDLGFKPSGR